MINITFENIIVLIITISTIAVFVAIAADFVLYNEKKATKQSQKSIVATGSMIAFYIVYYFTLRLHLGALFFESELLTIAGTSAIVLGSVINVVARAHLGANWANHIKIYSSHALIISGMYKLVRHPLYASLMLMLLGGSIVYRNWLAALLTIFVFIPAMYYRAKQEEVALLTAFDDYTEYKNNTGMFFPKFWS